MTRFLVTDAVWTERPVTMRLPFQFGSTEVRETAEAYCTICIEVNGETHIGRAAQLMVPRWFDKRDHLSNADTIDELRDTIDAATRAAVGLSGSAIEVTRRLRADIAEALPDLPPLAAGFGPSLVEMAMLDALCHAAGLPFWKAAHDDLFGLADAPPDDLTSAQIRDSLSAITAPETLVLRHTVGFDAPLRPEDVGPDAPDDGLPVSLQDVIARHGITSFKIKLKGDPDADLARLRAIADVIESVPDYTVSLDANEQYQRAPFETLLNGLASNTALRRLYGCIRFVEQPFSRDTALSGPVSAPLPLIIDESDDSEDAFARALTLGWSGTSIKSCKGVLRALLNRVRAQQSGAILSGEDLTCQPGLCWQQDSAMMAACDVPDCERNGHHFAGGLQGALDTERQHLLNAHADIYQLNGSRPTLRIDNGTITVRSLGCVGFANEFR